MINPYRDLDNFISSEINRNFSISQSEIETPGARSFVQRYYARV